MKTTTLPTKNSVNHSHVRLAFLLIPLVLALACFTLPPAVWAVDPPPDGGYPNQNTAEGDNALFNLTTGFSNTATGASALYHNQTGNNNTANGVNALENNNADNNTATGYQALFFNSSGHENTATGVEALRSNTTGFSNTANGIDALYDNTTGMDSTATGAYALVFNTTGSNNTASGVAALASNTTGNSNTATGFSALTSNTTASGNTANGFNALFANTTGANNIALGFQAGRNLTTGSNNIDIGNNGVSGESRTIRIGRRGTHGTTFVAGIFGATVPTGVAVIIDSSGHLGTIVSSERFKDAVKPMDKASEAILSLKPVTFRYKEELDPDRIPQFGLVAEEVEKVNRDLVARDDEGKPYTIRYEAVNAMLLNEFLKARRQIDAQQKQIDALTAGLQKVSAQLATGRIRVAAATGPEATISPPQIVLNTQ